MRSARRSISGQALVETSLTLPLVVFLVLGTLQLFLLLQARIAAQYAVYKATRAGATMHGACEAMTDTAVAALLPTITRTDSPLALADAFWLRRRNRYADGTPVHRGQIVELVRESPTPESLLPAEQEDNRFDQPGRAPVRLDVRMVYWYRLKVPFAAWVMSAMFLAHFNLQQYRAVNPLMVTQSDARWTGTGTLSTETWPGGMLGTNMRDWANAGHYLFPIRVSASMPMMVPPRQVNFPDRACPP